ncbi:MAG TPA: NAD(+) synthase [Candidatus Limnocylindria bacterium]|nr:NAD(+) synthase [Candidatus Limnocylindria bacterium]
MRGVTEAFLDVRRHGFARVAVCVPAVRVADPAFNAEAHLAELRGAYERGAHYALCPELGLSSYTCGDLFFQDRLLDGALAALAALADATRTWSFVFSVGLPLRVGGGLYNCAVTLANGRPLAVAPKAYPANYREFYELRWFQPARHADAETITLLGEEVPFGTDLLIALPELPGFVLHTEICEDIWVPVPPSTLAALAGATVLANLSASNVTVGKFEYRRDLVRMSSAKNLAVQLYTAAGFGESTADLAWDGHGLIADRGEVLVETERFTTGGSHVVADVDLAALASDRARQTSFAANAADCAPAVRRVEAPAEAERRPVSTWTSLERRVTPTPFVPTDPAELDRRCRELFLIQATSLARRLIALPEGRRQVVLGVSGGRDSTHALLVAVHAMDLLGLPRTGVIGLTMPGFGTSDRTYQIACRLVRALGATLRETDIRRMAQEAFAALGHDPQVEDLTFENVQAWSRKLLLFAAAGQAGAIDLGTSDLSELALGFATYGGDHMSHYGVNAGVPKTLISALIAWAGERVFAGEPEVARTLREVLALPISPELLRPAADGAIVQRSEEVVGPYELHDFFLYHFVRFGLRPERLARLALAAFAPRYDLATIKRWLIVFLERFFASQFKRDCVPDSPKVGSGGSLSPRGDWRMPADASAAAWLEAARAIPDA